MPGEDRRALLSDALTELRSLRAEVASLRRGRNEPIAIVGAACRFPGGVHSLDDYWRLLRDGVDATGEIPQGRWDVDAYFDPNPDAPGKMYVRRGAFLDDVESFDAEFFGISPREAVRLDPQQRMLLEVGWEALEDSAIPPGGLSGSATGVFVGVMSADYAYRQAHNLTAAEIDPYMLTGGDLSFAAGRLAYHLGLQGPAMSVATACSSSLVAVHLASQALRAGECDLALAAGVNLILDPVVGVMLSKLRALSPEGRSKPFDASADGYARGEGCGVIVLERLSDAARNRHRILALVRGSAVNHDGPSAGLTVPNGTAQEKLLRSAFAAAGVEPRDIDYIEAHGTGTALGDPIEAAALARLMAGRERPLPIGSVKSAIGHLEAAAGVAGVLKTVLALQHRALPPTLHFRTPSPHIPWERIPLRVVRELMDWPAGAGPRRAGVSSFGLSGVNAHVVLEEAPAEESRATVADADSYCLLTLSAKTREALAELANRCDDFLAQHTDIPWRDICFTANNGRTHLEHRRYVVARSAEEARGQLRGAAKGEGGPERSRLEAMGEAYLRGEPVDWAAAGEGRRSPLPAYPFQRRRYWVLDDKGTLGPAAQVGGGVTVASGVQNTADKPGATLLEALCEKAGQALGMQVAVDPGECLLDYGLDSLMAAELQDWLRIERGMQADVEQILAERPVRDLVSSLQPKPQAQPAPAARVQPAAYPLSEGQKALWFIYESDAANAAYNVGVALRIRAAVDEDAMRHAFQGIVDRHATLRAVFSAPEGEPLQEIRAEIPVRFERTSAAGWPDRELTERVREAHRRPFDLRTGPVFRVDLFTRAAEDHVLLLSMHHIACDALSFWTLLDEFQTLYAGGTLPAPALTYADFVRWQRELLDGPEGARLWEFWREDLSGELPILALPADKPRPQALRFEGASCTLSIPAALTARLRALARAEEATLHNALLAAYAALLARYTGQDEVVLGSATSGRPGEFAGVVGYFTNPVPIRLNLSGDPAFRELVARVRRAAMEAIEHQMMPFPALVKRLQPKRLPGIQPVFQADFALLKRPPAYRRGSGAGLPLEPFELAAEEGQFDLSLHVTDDESSLIAAFKYNVALFEPATIRGLADCFLNLLETLAADPAQRIGAAPLLAEPERRRLLAAGCGPQIEYEAVPAHRMIERRAALAPDEVAAEEFERGARWTFAELNRRSNRIAHRLRALGAGPDTLIGVCLGRSLELAAAILGTLKASAAYVPLDPGYPPARLEMTIEDAGILALVTSREMASRLKVPEGVSVVVLDRSWSEIPLTPDEDLPCAAGPVNLAYAIYTSGSTGKPKSALITHRGLTNYLSWCLEEYRVEAGCGAPVSSAISFDATVTSFLAPLAAGRKIVLLPERGVLEALAECLRRNRGFSLVKITPAHLDALSQMLAPEECAGRANAFIIGGEALRGESLAFWTKHAPGARFINEYGPTETVVGCCVYETSGAAPGSVPIGRPIANTQLYALDARMSPVPRGVTGELYIGGAGVGRGYLNRPEETETRFVPDPFSQEAGATLFRTGDLVKLLPDGNFEFLGRADRQVKLRGYRIELGEIESALAQHPGVATSLVVLQQDRLAAYVTPDSAPPAGELRRYLEQRLPEYMVPAYFLALPEFPLTPNGKIDRKALPLPEAARAASHFVAPRDSVELKIAAAWEEALGMRPVGVKDDFFDLGGHSLLAVRLMTTLQREFGKPVPLAAILRCPTVERLADLVRNGGTGPRSALVPIHAAGSKPPFYCVPGAGGNVIYLYNLARRLGPDQPFFGLQAAGFDGEAPPQTTVESMAAHYLAAIKAAQPHGPYYLGGHSLGGWVAYEMAQQLLRERQDVPLVAIVDTPVPEPGPAHETGDWDNARWIIELANRIGQLLNPALAISLESLRALDADAQFEYFKKALIDADLFPGDAGNDHLKNVLTLFKAHSQVRYRLPEHPLPVRVALLRTATPPRGVAAVSDPSWGWSSIAQTEVHVVPGEHLTALRPPHVPALADCLADCLDQAHRAHAEFGKAAACQA